MTFIRGGEQPDPRARALIEAAAEAQERFGDDELEAHAARLREEKEMPNAEA